MDSLSALQNNIKSSAKHSMIHFNGFASWIVVEGFATAFGIKGPGEIFHAKHKINGKTGCPCLRLLLVGKASIRLPLISNKYLMDVRHFINTTQSRKTQSHQHIIKKILIHRVIGFMEINFQKTTQSTFFFAIMCEIILTQENIMNDTSISNKSPLSIIIKTLRTSLSLEQMSFEMHLYKT